ncbi:MAG: apolipoprotein N-acyltransferase [Pseudanabaenaceae cyanobacterium bins.68]|nr:apolipoprotein N-acyltransferase [Pseudanabaenaceae cyanobacterium bins.68]
MKLGLNQTLVALLGGICMGLTVAPWQAWPLAAIALVPLWWLTQGLSPAQAAIAGAVWGFGYHGLALFWITGIHPMTWLGVGWWSSLAIAIGVWLLITCWGMILVAIWAGGMAWWSPKLGIWQRICLGCAWFCLLETIWSHGSLYWTALGYTQSPENLGFLQISKLSGQQTVTAAIVALNGLIAETRRDRRSLVAAGILISAIYGYGLNEMRPDVVEAANLIPLKAGIIQGNIPNSVKLSTDGIQLSLDRYLQGYQALAQAQADLILTPETAIPLLFPQRSALRQEFDRVIQANPVPMWLGAFGRSSSDRLNYTNSLFLIKGSTAVIAQYHKVKLVPIGEFIPFKSILGSLIQRLSPLRGEVEPGQPNQLVDSPWGRLILAICYESAYPEHFRYQAAAAGQLILTAANNAHYAAAMPAQHHAQDVARAIETNRWAVRATNTGYSGIVDPVGRTLWQSGLNTSETHLATVYLRQTLTPYVRWGDWLTKLLVAISLVNLLIVHRARQRDRSG